MRASASQVRYLLGTPRGRLTKVEKALRAKPWEDVREHVRVKLIEDGEETCVLAPGAKPGVRKNRRCAVVACVS
jgi:hypothetical protein